MTVDVAAWLLESDPALGWSGAISGGDTRGRTAHPWRMGCARHSVVTLSRRFAEHGEQ